MSKTATIGKIGRTMTLVGVGKREHRIDAKRTSRGVVVEMNGTRMTLEEFHSAGQVADAPESDVYAAAARLIGLQLGYTWIPQEPIFEGPQYLFHPASSLPVPGVDLMLKRANGAITPGTRPEYVADRKCNPGYVDADGNPLNDVIEWSHA